MGKIQLLEMAKIFKPSHNITISKNNINSFIRKYLKEIGFADREIVAIIMISSNSKLAGVDIVAIGNESTLCASSSAIIRNLLRTCSKYAIIVHNHPGGNVKPSDNDIESIKAIYKIFEFFGIVMLDYVIISHNKFFRLSSNKVYKLK